MTFSNPESESLFGSVVSVSYPLGKVLPLPVDKTVEYYCNIIPVSKIYSHKLIQYADFYATLSSSSNSAVLQHSFMLHGVIKPRLTNAFSDGGYAAIGNHPLAQAYPHRDYRPSAGRN